MREEAIRGIKRFFQAAINNLNKPDDITDLLANHCEEHRKDPNIHNAFYAKAYNGVCLQLLNKNGYAKFTFGWDLPKGEYMMMESDYNRNIMIKLEDVENIQDENVKKYDVENIQDENVKKYIKSYISLSAGRDDFLAAANIALEERTVERVLERLPELKRFLP
jgi:hypothetical protein